ncbi:GTP-binding protein [Nonomuraea candida]|uniref:GTP-binding protein n=1 Tax=Nonomuraea candida TaxID=359159 RepID=UPI000A462A93|nr:ATP/GTP-binding protein [Nonomuraea candida]
MAGGFGVGKTTFVGAVSEILPLTTEAVMTDASAHVDDVSLTPKFMWDDLVKGAIGAVVLVDTRRLADSFPAIDYFEEAKLPFVIGINGWDGHFAHAEEEIREALSIGGHTPIVRLDARQRESVKSTLITLVEHALTRHMHTPV